MDNYKNKFAVNILEHIIIYLKKNWEGSLNPVVALRVHSCVNMTLDVRRRLGNQILHALRRGIFFPSNKLFSSVTIILVKKKY